MNITFTATTQSSEVSLALAKLITNSPQKTLDEIISDLILSAASAVKHVPDKDELMPDVIAVTEFILENIRPTNNTRIDDWVDTCYKRGVVTKNYKDDSFSMRRLVEWVIDELAIRTNGLITKNDVFASKGYVTVSYKYKPVPVRPPNV